MNNKRFILFEITKVRCCEVKSKVIHLMALISVTSIAFAHYRRNIPSPKRWDDNFSPDKEKKRTKTEEKLFFSLNRCELMTINQKL